MAPSTPVPQAAAAGGAKEESELDMLGKELSTCLLSQYAFSFVGLGLGTGLGIYKKSLLPLVGGGAVGSVGDLFYGLGYACKGKFEAYKACKDRVEPPRVALPPPPPRGARGGVGGGGEESKR